MADRAIASRFVASVFWGFYESAEIRLIERHLSKQTDVVELGASIGVVSSHIAARLGQGHRLIVVEPNPTLLPTLKSNIDRHLADGASAHVEHAAFSTSQTSVALCITDNRDHTATQISDISKANAKSIIVPAMSLTAVIERHNLVDYTLVCDIEGTEIALLQYDMNALDRCQHLFIELHETTSDRRYSVADLIQLIETAGFQLEEAQGNAVYFSKRPRQPK